MSGEILENGQVVEVREGSVDVRVKAGAACAHCNHCSTLDKGGMLIADVRNDIGAAKGDNVEVEIPAGADLRAGLLTYIVPVAALLGGYAIGNVAGSVLGMNADGFGAVCALAAFAAAMLYVRMAARVVLESERFRPRLRAIIPARQPRSASAAADEMWPV